MNILQLYNGKIGRWWYANLVPPKYEVRYATELLSFRTDLLNVMWLD
jgi:hypothetical protein